MAKIQHIETEGKGRIYTVRGIRPMKVKKDSRPFKKASVFQLRMGHEYEKQLSTMEAREAGREAWGLPDYLERVSPCIRRHVGTGVLYIVGQPHGNQPAATFYNEYGAEVHKETAMENALASEKKPPTRGEWMMYKLENVESII